MNNLDRVKQIVSHGVGAYNMLLAQAAQAEEGNLDWVDVRREALLMASGLSKIARLIRASKDQALIKLTITMLTASIALAVAVSPKNVDHTQIADLMEITHLLRGIGQ